MPSDTEPIATDPTVLNKIKELLDDPAFLEGVKSARKRRPAGNSLTSVCSYYRDTYAIEIKLVIDQMIETQKDFEFKFSDYPELKASSMKMRVYHGFKYLVDYMDPDGKYTALRRDLIEIKALKTGIRMCWFRDALNGRRFNAVPVDVTEPWRDEILKFIEDRSQKILHMKNMSLTNEEIGMINDSYSGIDGLYVVATEREIKIVKDKSLIDDFKE